MDMQDIRKLFELADKYKVAEVEFNNDEVSLRITRHHPVEGNIMMPNTHMPTTIAMPHPNTPATPNTATETPAVADVSIAGTEIKSPMVGSFYAAPAPGSKPFITQGQQVKEGDTLCIIEAMKIMNPIKSDIAGTVVKILVDNGDPVEYGQPLFIIG